MHAYRGAADADRAWNTWDSVFPCDMIHLPLGLRVSFCAYAASRNAFTRFPPGEGVRLGPRTLDGACVRVDLGHAGTEIVFTWAKPDADAIVGTWRATRFGEWGLRFWPLVVLQADDGADLEWRHDEATGAISATREGRAIVVKGLRKPLMVTYHASIEALAAEYHDKGYFYLASRDARGSVVALRYNLEEMAEHRFAVVVKRGAAAAGQAASAALDGPAAASPAPARHEGRGAGALDAVRDVIGWNSVWDPVNRRPYTLLSRHWVAQKFGGFGVWLDDVLYHGLMANLFDARFAADNVAAVLAGATEWGNLPCLITGNDAWVDRSQPPIASFIVRMVDRRNGDRAFLERAFPVLLANHDWWWRTRDGNGNGLLEYGTSPVGRGLYRSTKLAAKDESMMDNAPVHDEATFVEATNTLDCEDVALNSLVALDGEVLAAIARDLGDEVTALRLEARTEALKARVRTGLWDESRGIFANRLWSGRFVRSLAPTSFFPFIAGIPDERQTERMIRDHLLNGREFWGEHVLPAVARDDPAFHDNVYWRGRVWPPLNTIVYYGLRRMGRDDVAGELVARGHATFAKGWERDRHCGENFSAVTGEIQDQPDTDPFYAWGALMAYLAVADVIDVDPWLGLTARHDGRDVTLGPLRGPGGDITVTGRDGWLRVDLAGRQLFRANRTGRYAQIEVAPGRLAMTVPAGAAGARLVVPGAGKDAAATLDGAAIQTTRDGDDFVTILPPTGGALRVRGLSV
jgi:putative isomerase